MTYWEIYYGKCLKNKNGSPQCCAYCEICGGINWIPLGPKSFKELLDFYNKDKHDG